MTDLNEVTERLLLIRKYGRERRIETRKSEIAILRTLSFEQQGEVMVRVERQEAALKNALCGGREVTK